MGILDKIVEWIATQVMNGLDLIKHAREINEHLVTFVISGYGDFEYTRTAISYNVAGYLMKPLEWLFLVVLYTFDRKPENRICSQYLG